jgi:hypothetical protein
MVIFVKTVSISFESTLIIYGGLSPSIKLSRWLDGIFRKIRVQTQNVDKTGCAG